MKKFVFIVALCIMVASCSSIGNKNTTEDSNPSNLDSIAPAESNIWYWVNYDDGFGNSIDAKYLQAAGTAFYSDPTVEKMECATYISIDPNIGKAILTFSNGQNSLKGLGEMSIQIKDSNGHIHTARFFNSEDGTSYTLGDNDIIYELLKTEEPIAFRIEQKSYGGHILITFQFPNDKHFNQLIKEVPLRDKSFYNAD